jgi:transcriptional antiterminator RfaH
MTSNRSWFVVQTQPHAETKASAHLTRQGFEIYLPRYLKQRRHARRLERVVAPLFPRYMFVAVDLAVERWRAIQSTVGVSRLVCSGDSPTPVAPDMIAGFKDREDERGFVKIEGRVPFAPGDRIRAAEGAFAACLGLFEGMTDRERVAILLDLLGRKVRVFLDLDLVTAA